VWLKSRRLLMSAVRTSSNSSNPMSDSLSPTVWSNHARHLLPSVLLLSSSIESGSCRDDRMSTQTSSITHVFNHYFTLNRDSFTFWR
jgi:hypothetical protein